MICYYISYHYYYYYYYYYVGESAAAAAAAAASHIAKNVSKATSTQSCSQGEQTVFIIYYNIQ